MALTVGKLDGHFISLLLQHSMELPPMWEILESTLSDILTVLKMSCPLKRLIVEGSAPRW